MGIKNSVVNHSNKNCSPSETPVTYKQTKEWLRRAWNIDREIDLLARQHLEEVGRVTSITAQLTGMPSAASKDPHKFDRIAEIEDGIQEKIIELQQTKKEIRDAIMLLDDNNQRQVLMMYYITTNANGRHKTFEEIGEEMNYTGQYIRLLHKKAVESVNIQQNSTRHM